MIEIQCSRDECNGVFEFAVNVESNYGADADGNRGSRVYFVEAMTQTCDCALLDSEMEELKERAFAVYEDFSEGLY